MRTDLLARLGEVSEDRAVQPLWALVDRVSNKNAGMAETNLLSLSYGRVIPKEIDTLGGLRPESFETYNVIEAGDSVLRMTDLQNDQRSIRTALANERGIITSAYVTVRPRPGVVDPRFLAAALRAYDVKKVYYEMGAGVRQTLKFEELAHLPIPLPSLPAQVRLAEFLDRETAEIDAMDAELNHLVALLGERKQAAIARAFDVRAPRVGLGLVLEGIKDGTHGSFARTVSGEGMPLLGARNVMDGQLVLDGNESFISREDHASIVSGGWPRRNDVLLVIVGATIGKAAVYQHDVSHAFQRSVSFLRPGPGLHPRALWYQLRSSRFQEQLRMKARVSAQPGVYLGDVAGIQVDLPSLDEQRKIVAELDETTARIDEMIADANRLKALLAERRSTLITEVVTGKKAVPA